MKLFRRGHLYLAYHALDRGFVVDASTGEFTAELDPREFMGNRAAEWLPVLDSEPIPQALHDRLVLRIPGLPGRMSE